MTTTDPYPFGGFGAPPQSAPAFDTSPPHANEAPAAPPPAPPQQAAGPPVFGRRDPAATVKRVEFQLATYDQRGTETLHPLTSLADVDMASVFGLGRAGGDMRYQIATIRSLLMRCLVDDDGISLRESAVEVADHGEGEDVVPLAELTDEQRRDALADADVVWQTPDGELHDTPELAAAHMREHGSSLRRFAAIMDDDSLIVQQEALEQIIDFVMSAAADRPTKRSSGSSRSRQRKGR